MAAKVKIKIGWDTKNVSVDIQSGLINKVAVTSAKVPDAQKLHDICHDEGADMKT